MILNGSFYIINSCDKIAEDAYVVDVELMSQHPIYTGHFPGRPILPGVCTLTIIKECLSRLLKRNVDFVVIKECKFISVLYPESGLIITINITLLESSKVRVAVVRKDTRQDVLKLKATIRV